MPDPRRWTAGGGDPNLNDINRTDQFIEALSANQPAYSTDHAEAELAFLLAEWRDGVRETPVSAVVTVSDAEMALTSARAPHRPNRLSLAVLGSAAAAVLCAGGFGVAVYGAGPGDGLYGMRAMIFGEQQVTRDDRVVLAAQQELAQVQQLVDQGQWEQAQDRLAALSTTVQSVDTVEQKQDLIEQWNALTYKVVEQDPAATLPPAGDPAPVLLPDSPLTLLPIPVVTDTTTTTTTTTTETATSETTTTPGPEVVLTPPPVTSTPPPSTTPSPSTPPPSTTPSSTLTPSTTPSPTLTPSTTPSPSPSSIPSTTIVVPTTPPATTPATTPPAPSTTPPASSTTRTTTTTTTTTTTSRQPAPPPVAETPATSTAPARPTVDEVPVTTTTVVAPVG